MVEKLRSYFIVTWASEGGDPLTRKQLIELWYVVRIDVVLWTIKKYRRWKVSRGIEKKQKKPKRKSPLDFTEACVKWLEQKGIKLQAALLAAALNEGKKKKAKLLEVKQQKNEMKKRGNNITFYSMDY